MVNETSLNAHGNSYESFHTDVKTNTLINITIKIASSFGPEVLRNTNKSLYSAALVILIKDNLCFMFNNTNRDWLDCVV